MASSYVAGDFGFQAGLVITSVTDPGAPAGAVAVAMCAAAFVTSVAPRGRSSYRALFPADTPSLGPAFTSSLLLYGLDGG